MNTTEFKKPPTSPILRKTSSEDWSMVSTGGTAYQNMNNTNNNTSSGSNNTNNNIIDESVEGLLQHQRNSTTSSADDGIQTVIKERTLSKVRPGSLSLPNAEVPPHQQEQQQQQPMIPTHPTNTLNALNTSTNANTSSHTLRPIPPPVHMTHYEAAWERFRVLLDNEFDDADMAILNWDTLFDMIKYVGVTNPLEIARIQIAWRNRQRLLGGPPEQQQVQQQQQQVGGGNSTQQQPQLHATSSSGSMDTRGVLHPTTSFHQLLHQDSRGELKKPQSSINLSVAAAHAMLHGEISAYGGSGGFTSNNNNSTSNHRGRSNSPVLEVDSSFGLDGGRAKVSSYYAPYGAHSVRSSVSSTDGTVLSYYPTTTTAIITNNTPLSNGAQPGSHTASAHAVSESSAQQQTGRSAMASAILHPHHQQQEQQQQQQYSTTTSGIPLISSSNSSPLLIKGLVSSASNLKFLPQQGSFRNAQYSTSALPHHASSTYQQGPQSSHHKKLNISPFARNNSATKKTPPSSNDARREKSHNAVVRSNTVIQQSSSAIQQYANGGMPHTYTSFKVLRQPSMERR